MESHLDNGGKGRTTGHEKSGRKKNQGAKAATEQKQKWTRRTGGVRGERHQKSEYLDARDVIKIQGGNFNTVLQFKMGCFSFLNIINKQQLKKQLKYQCQEAQHRRNLGSKAVLCRFLYGEKVRLMDSPSTDKLSWLGVFVVFISHPYRKPSEVQQTSDLPTRHQSQSLPHNGNILNMLNRTKRTEA